jgi:hypothetical protein
VKVWKQIAFATVIGAASFAAIAAFFLCIFPWEVSWIKSAGSLTLTAPEETLTAVKLQEFLAGFESDNSGAFGLTCTLQQRNGHIRIGGQTYPADLVFDKFRGDVLIVHHPWKNVEVARRRH